MRHRRHPTLSRKERKRFRNYVGLVIAVGVLVVSALVTWIKYQKNVLLLDQRTIQLNESTPTNLNVEVTGNDIATNALTPISQGESPN